MAITAKCVSLSFVLLQVFLLSLSVGSANAKGLKVGFYSKTCPNVESIVQGIMQDVIGKAPSLAGPLLRLHFHDCFVRGCDGSILLNSTSAAGQAEKDAPPNLTLRGFQIIDRVKTALEKQCPGVVSCSDIVALVARDAVVQTGGLSWNVETGRRDGTVSILNEALSNLPPPFFNITQLKANFKGKGLSVKDLVVLSGGHTIGTSHCAAFVNRLYNFTGKGTNNDTDPTLDSNYVANLRKKCAPSPSSTVLVQMDPGSFKTFDEHYFLLVSKRRGLFQSDAALLDDPVTKQYVISHESANPKAFFKDFGVSMIKMGRIGVITGKAGEIRKVCGKIN